MSNVHDDGPPPADAGNVLALVAAASFGELGAELARLGYRATPVDDPYAAMAELLDRPLVYRALVVSLPALYREELALIRTVRSRLPHVDVLLAHTDGRHAALAEAMRLGATGLLSEAAVHRLAEVEATAELAAISSDASAARSSVAAASPFSSAEVGASSAHGFGHHDAAEDGDDLPQDMPDFEPLLTAAELRALLQEQPMPPCSDDVT